VTGRCDETNRRCGDLLKKFKVKSCIPNFARTAPRASIFTPLGMLGSFMKLRNLSLVMAVSAICTSTLCLHLHIRHCKSHRVRRRLSQNACQPKETFSAALFHLQLVKSFPIRCKVSPAGKVLSVIQTLFSLADRIKNIGWTRGAVHSFILQRDWLEQKDNPSPSKCVYGKIRRHTRFSGISSGLTLDKSLSMTSSFFALAPAMYSAAAYLPAIPCTGMGGCRRADEFSLCQNSNFSVRFSG
jgi:hypothetical protein